MTNDWPIARLGDVLDIINGRNQRAVESESGQYPIYGSGGIIGRATGFLCEAGSTVVGRKGSINSPMFVDSRFWNVDTAFGLSPRPGLDCRFLYLFCQHYDFTDHNKGTTLPSLVKTDLLEIRMPCPPLAEQQRIVGILDEAFEGTAIARENAAMNLRNARALYGSHLTIVFTRQGEGWEEKRLGDASRITYGYTESASAEKVGPKFLRITDIQDNRVDWSAVPYCPIESSDLAKYKLVDGDIVFARTGATTGKSYLVADPPEAVFASYLIRVQVNAAELLPGFLYLFFQTHSYWDSIRFGVSGSAQGGFNATKLAELVIPYPTSPTEQQSIVDELYAVSQETQRLESIYQRKLAALDELKKSLLHQAFAGTL